MFLYVRLLLLNTHKIGSYEEIKISEVLLLNTHNVCLCREIRKNIKTSGQKSNLSGAVQIFKPYKSLPQSY